MEHSRFWASVEGFRLICPQCQQFVLAAVAPGHGKSHIRSYDRQHQVLECPHCLMVSHVGLLLWPAIRGGHRFGRDIPPDVKLTKRELMELRRITSGWWMRQPHKDGERVNLWIPEACTCAPDPWRASCPIHGSETSTMLERKG